MTCFLIFIQGNELKMVGCQVHGREVTANIIKFYALTKFAEAKAKASEDEAVPVSVESSSVF